MPAPTGVIDWSKPIEAVPAPKFRGGRVASASVHPKYAKRPDAVAVRFDQNLWTDDSDSGTWYFNHEGEAVAGISEDGYDARYYIRNAA